MMLTLEPYDGAGVGGITVGVVGAVLGVCTNCSDSSSGVAKPTGVGKDDLGVTCVGVDSEVLDDLVIAEGIATAGAL
jgi:hypothetical protein